MGTSYENLSDTDNIYIRHIQTKDQYSLLVFDLHWESHLSSGAIQADYLSMHWIQ